MAYLIPPMEDEPPPGFIMFVAARLNALRSETVRLVGGDRAAPEVTMEVLTDLAGHWRGLTWLGRLTHRDTAGQYLHRRLSTRTKQWREEQIYPVEVNVLSDHGWSPAREQILETAGAPPRGSGRPDPVPAAAALYHRPSAPPGESLARQLASYLPTTVRSDTEVLADAGIAWVHAYRRYVWRRYFRMGAAMVFLIGYLIQLMTQLSAPT